MTVVVHCSNYQRERVKKTVVESVNYRKTRGKSLNCPTRRRFLHPFSLLHSSKSQTSPSLSLSLKI